MVPHDQNHNVAPQCHDLRNAVIPFSIPLASCDINNSSDVTPYLDYLDQTNAMVPLMRPLSSHYSDANGIT